jgi:hypothetical protein
VLARAEEGFAIPPPDFDACADSVPPEGCADAKCVTDPCYSTARYYNADGTECTGTACPLRVRCCCGCWVLS